MTSFHRNRYGYTTTFAPETLEQFRNGVRILHLAEIYAHRIDWLLSGDDGEYTFHRRLASDLKGLPS